MATIDPSAYVAYWRERERREAGTRQQCTDRARSYVPHAVRILAAHGARRIWLIGSLPRGSFEPSSDIDFMTEGLAGQAAVRAASDAAAQTGMSVDIIRSEELDPEWREYHERFGQVVHG